MPIATIFYLFDEGPPAIIRNNAYTIAIAVAVVAVLTLLKRWTSGTLNTSERDMHGKVVIITGGTSGVGASTAFELASRGAQLVLLTQAPPSDPFLVEYIDDLREQTNNQLIYAEQVDLSSLHSVRKFATAWIDNAPPRRLDMIVLCAASMAAPGSKRVVTAEGIEETWMVNFLANFHLLGILSPAIRAQPFDRDVRILIATCSSYIGSPSLKEPLTEATWQPGTAYARSKLALTVFGQAFQKHLDSYKRPDDLPMNARVTFVDPGMCRTPGTRRWLTRGSILGLLLYVAFYAVPWFLFKSASRGAQSFLFAAMDAQLHRVGGGKLIKECMMVDFARSEVMDEAVAKKLWEESDALIEKTEKAAAKKRAVDKANDVKAEEKKNEEERVKEINDLMGAIKKGKEREKENKEKGKGKARRRAK